METKYVKSNYRVTISYDEVQFGIRDGYTDIDFHFLKEEICGDKADFVLAFGVVMKAAIKHTGITFVNRYNKKECIKEKYLRMALGKELDIEKTKEMLVKACEVIEIYEFNEEKRDKLPFVFKHESEIRECAKKVKEAILTGVDCKSYYQYIPSD